MATKGRKKDAAAPHAPSGPPQAGMSYTVRPTAIRYRGVSVPYQLPAWRSDGDDDAIIEGAEAERMDEVFVPLRDYVDSIASPASIRLFRDGLGLSLEDAADIFGVSADALAAYESGEREIPPELLNLFRLVASDPQRLQELRLTPERLRGMAGASPRPAKANRRFALVRRRGLGGREYVAVRAEGLRTHVMLLPAPSGRPAYRILTQQAGIRSKGRAVYRRGPLDEEHVEEIVAGALREHGLDPERAAWDDILAAAYSDANR